jgi:hypothetical protein
MDVVTAVSNLRARNYKIKEADMHKTRQIAGKVRAPSTPSYRATFTCTPYLI